MTQSLCEFTRFTRWIQNGARRLPTFGPSHGLEPLARLEAPSPFIITQPERWHSFYYPIEGRRLSRPRRLVTVYLPSSNHPSK